MTPEYVAKARKLIGKPWYNRWRALQMRMMFRYTDKYIPCDGFRSKDTLAILEMYLRREIWYRVKMQENENTGRHTDR